ncbi:MAG: hypothetical protein GX342_02495 [Alcaligenaceae bacterium]|nr:hypothetical protein [Alcaligenaceae bacterium]
MINYKLMAVVAAAFTLGACTTQGGEAADVHGCAVSNQRIIHSDAQVGPGAGNFLNRNRLQRNADYERERARRLDCGQF